MDKLLHTNKDGWKIYGNEQTGTHHFAKKGDYTISSCHAGDEIKYIRWEKYELKGVYGSFIEAKPKKLRTDKDWKRLGKKYGVEARMGESWVKFKARIQERI